MDVRRFRALEARYGCSGVEVLRYGVLEFWSSGVLEFSSAGGMEEFLGGAL